MGEVVAIRKCQEAEIARIGLFYGDVIRGLNDHINHPRWIYRVCPSGRSARRMAEKGARYVCLICFYGKGSGQRYDPVD